MRACCQAIKRLVNGFALVPRMAAVSRADDDTVPGHPGTVSEALLSVLFEALRLELAQKTRAAADAASTSVDSEDVEKALLTICARVNRNVAVDVLLRNNAAKVPLTEAHRKLSEFTLTNVEDPVAGARAAAGAYDEVCLALRHCSPSEAECVRVAAVSVRDAVVLSCMSVSGYRDRYAFAAALDDAFIREVKVDDDLYSQLYNSYHHLMATVPGAFQGGKEKRTLLRRQYNKRSRGRAAVSQPSQADVEPTAVAGMSTAASITVPAVLVQSIASRKGAVDRTGDSFFPPGDWRHAGCDGYQDFRSVSAVSSHDDFVQVEPRQSAQDPLIGVNIRRLLGDAWYDAQIMSMHQQLCTGDWCYIVRYSDGTTEFLQNYMLHQGVLDLLGPSPPYADPGISQEPYAKNVGLSMGSTMQSDDESEKQTELTASQWLNGIEEEPSENKTKL